MKLLITLTWLAIIQASLGCASFDEEPLQKTWPIHDPTEPRTHGGII